MVSDTGYLGIVLCRDYENGLGDHIAIKGHDGPTRDLLSLNYIQTSPYSHVVGVVWFLTQAISALCHVETMKMVLVTIWTIKGHDGPISDIRSHSYIQTFPNSYVFGVVYSLTQSNSSLYYVETMKMVMMTI